MQARGIYALLLAACIAGWIFSFWAGLPIQLVFLLGAVASLFALAATEHQDRQGWYLGRSGVFGLLSAFGLLMGPFAPLALVLVIPSLWWLGQWLWHASAAAGGNVLRYGVASALCVVLFFVLAAVAHNRLVGVYARALGIPLAIVAPFLFLAWAYQLGRAHIVGTTARPATLM
ncbi:MAG: hypothetical protein V4510_01550 [bacterium]